MTSYHAGHAVVNVSGRLGDAGSGTRFGRLVVDASNVARPHGNKGRQRWTDDAR
jgi:hypothetical protein